MSGPEASAGRSSELRRYAIRVQGKIDAKHWVRWFEGLTVSVDEDGTTVLVGPLIDQAALYGLLRKVRDLGLPLISVTVIEYPSDTETSQLSN